MRCSICSFDDPPRVWSWTFETQEFSSGYRFAVVPGLLCSSLVALYMATPADVGWRWMNHETEARSINKEQERTLELAAQQTDSFTTSLPQISQRDQHSEHFSTVFVSSMRRKYVLSSMLQNHCCFARIKASEGWCVIMRSNTKEYSSKLLTYGGFNCHVWSYFSFESFACQHLLKLYMLLCRIWYAFPKIERTDWR